MIFNISNRADKLIFYTAREYGDDYSPYIGAIPSAGYQSQNLCIVSGYPNNIIVTRECDIFFT